MEQIKCRRCSKTFCEENIEFVGFDQRPETEDDVREAAVCPHCGCPIYEELTSENVWLEYPQSYELEVDNNSGEIIRRYEVSDGGWFVKNETILLTVNVKKIFDANPEQKGEDVLRWKVEYPERIYNQSDSEYIFADLKVGDIDKIAIEIRPIQRGKYRLSFYTL